MNARRAKAPATLPVCHAGCNERLLGELDGKLDMVIANQETHGTQLAGLDARLRSVESRSAVIAAGLGAAAGVAMAICTEFVKGILSRRT